MKQSFERILKEQLENYEMPYDNGAWEQFSKRLDGTPPTSFYRKWWFAASVGTVLVGSATYFALSSDDVKTSENAVIAETIAPSAKTIQETAPAKSDNSTDKTQDAASELKQQDPQQKATYTWEPGTAAIQTGHTIHIPASPLTIVTDRNEISTSLIISGENGTTNGYTRFEVPTSICLNESFTVRNPNESAVTVTLPNGRTKTIPAKQTAEIKASEAGKITVQSGNQLETITVNESVANLIIDVDQSIPFDQGIPTAKFNVLNADNPVYWTTTLNERPQNVTELTVHPYTEREVTVTAHSTDQNGCPVTEKKTIALEKYNLIAPNGFNPDGNSELSKTFMPGALRVRDTPFELIIMDAKTMATVYRTTDASQGWDGTDSRTGQIAAPGSTWLWKVILKAPQPGEKNEYSGMFTRFQQ
jgi:hypothetical protein